MLLAGNVLACQPDNETDRGAESTEPTKRFRRTGRIVDDRITECSGIVASRRYPDVYWVHNDSGHPAEIFAIRETGEVLAQFPVEGALNLDWEDIAIDDDGHIYIGDLGNNFGTLAVRIVYQVSEPDPFTDSPKPVRVERQIKYKYPDKRFDAESLFGRADKLHVIAKTDEPKATLYRLDENEGAYAKLTPLCEMPTVRATGADVSPDGKRLAVCGGFYLFEFVFDDNGIPNVKEYRHVYHPGSGVEACCYAGDDVLLAREKGRIYRITRADIELNTEFKPGKAAKRN